MNNLAVHMRITSLQVSNEDVDTRQAGVSELVAAWGELKDATLIVLKAAEIARALGGDGTPPATLGEEVEHIIQSHASAFLHIERPLEVGICSGVAVIELMSPDSVASDLAAPDIIAAALWSALQFQHPLGDTKREALRTKVLEVARLRATKAAESCRQRSEVNDLDEPAVSTDDETKLAINFKRAATATMTALRHNATLDREELDFLWWAQLGRSRLLNRPLMRIAEPVRLVAAGIEAAGYLRRLPCEVHRDVVLRTLDSDPKLNLTDLVAAVGDDRHILGNRYGDGIVAHAPEAFPLLHALATGSTSADGATVQRTSGEWGSRALLEAGLAQICTAELGKL